MKNIFLGALAILSSALFSSCDVTDNYALTAKINNQQWLSEKGVAAVMGEHAIIINALNNSKPAIAMVIKDLTPGEYPLDGVNNSFLYAFQGDQAGGYAATSSSPGKILIIKHDPTEKLITGTFEVVAHNELNGDSIRVTEGKFDVYYK